MKCALSMPWHYRLRAEHMLHGRPILGAPKMSGLLCQSWLVSSGHTWGDATVSWNESQAYNSWEDDSFYSRKFLLGNIN